MTIHQDARVYAGLFDANHRVEHALHENRHAWLQLARGTLTLNDLELKQGDGAGVSNETGLKIVAHDEAEVLLFDLA